MRAGSLELKKIGPQKIFPHLSRWIIGCCTGSFPSPPIQKHLPMPNGDAIKVSNADTPIHLDNLHMYIQQAWQNNVIRYLMLDLPYLNVPELQLKAILEGDTVNRMKSAFHFHMYEYCYSRPLGSPTPSGPQFPRGPPKRPESWRSTSPKALLLSCEEPKRIGDLLTARGWV